LYNIVLKRINKS